jgi:hypothetical protein
MPESPVREIAAGGLRFLVDYRRFGGDQGPSVRVYGDVDGRPVQLLRFDCFDNDPHYHYDPEGEDDHRKLDPQEIPDPVAWTLAQLAGNLVSMIRTAGYDQVADQLDAAAVSDAVPRIEAAVQEAAEAAGRVSRAPGARSAR